MRLHVTGYPGKVVVVLFSYRECKSARPRRIKAIHASSNSIPRAPTYRRGMQNERKDAKGLMVGVGSGLGPEGGRLAVEGSTQEWTLCSRVVGVGWGWWGGWLSTLELKRPWRTLTILVTSATLVPAIALGGALASSKCCTMPVYLHYQRTANLLLYCHHSR